MKHKILSLLIILSTILTSHAQVTIKQASGWFESASITWEHYPDADMYNVYIKEVNETSWIQIDSELIRNYGYYGRADMVGLKAGNYHFKIEATNNGNFISESTNTSQAVSVMAYDRAGFAHLDGNAVGAYNNDGTLKSNARILYIDNSNVDKVTLSVLNGKTETTLTGLGNILKGYEKGLEKRPLAIRFIGNINMTSSQLYGDADAMQIKGKENNIPMHITFEGIGNDAYLSDWGLVLVKSNNIEIRNLGIMLFNDDGVSLKESVKIWVHNCDFFYGKKGSAADQDKGDGSLDTKDDSQYCTFSYNHFWDAGKMALCGMKSETGPNYLSYHHNWFDHSDSRHPRVRRMSVHVYNNYYDGVSKYGIGATSGASIYVENNYFRNTKRPMMSSLQGTDAQGDGTFSGENGGIIKSYGNIFVECGNNFSYITANNVDGSGATAVSSTSFDAYQATSRDEAVPSSYKTLNGGTNYDNFDTNNSLMYQYTPDAAIDVPAKVKMQSGRMQGGDFSWLEFNNATEDNNYEVINDLMNEITSYKTSLIEIGSFTKTTAAPTTYTVTYYADVEGTTIYETMTEQRAIVYPQGTPTKDGYTFTGWSARQGASIQGNVYVYPTFCDGKNSTGGTTGGNTGENTTLVKKWDFTSWSDATKESVQDDASWVQVSDGTSRYEKTFDTPTAMGFEETVDITFQGKVRISWDNSKGSYLQGTFTMNVPVEPNQIITVKFSNTGSSGGSRDLLIDGNIVASSGNTSRIDGTYTVPEGKTHVTIAGSAGLNFYNITITAQSENVEKTKPTFTYNISSTTIDIADEVYELPILNNTSDGIVRYESSNTEVATIDNKGVVTPHTTGTTIIKATVDETDTYLSATAQYTLTVIDSYAPTYTVTFMVVDEIFAILEEQTVVVYPTNKPTVSGYSFVGWDTAEGTLLTQDLIVNAILKETTAETITLKAGDFPDGYTVDGTASGSLYTYSDNTKAKEVFTLNDGKHTVTIPNGVKATKVEFYGCAQNNESRDGITEFNGSSQSTTFTNRKSSEFTTITFDNLEIVDSFTFTLGYKSAIKIYIDVEPYDSAIDNTKETLNNINYRHGIVTANGTICIYNLQGVLIDKGLGSIDIHSLPQGIYLVKCGKEVIKIVR